MTATARDFRARLSPAVVLMAMAMASPSAEADRRLPPNINVTGTGEASAAPDTAELHAGVTAVDARAEAAIGAVSTRAKAVQAALAAQGVAAQDVQTSAVSLRPVRGRPDPRADGGEPPRITGYDARIDHRVTVRKIADVGGVLDAAIAAGANDVGGIRFTVADERKLTERARQLAMADAKRTAEALAWEAGVRIISVLEVQELEGGGPVPLMKAMRAEAGGVPVAPGSVTVRARVRVIYGIDKKKQ